MVGGGAVATRKVTQLIDCGLDVTVLSPKVTPALQRLERRGKLEWLRKSFPAGKIDLEAYDLIFAATSQRIVNASIAKRARAAGRMVNVADDPESSDFYTVAILRPAAPGVMVAISSSGRAPAVSRRLRKRLMEYLRMEFPDGEVTDDKGFIES